MADRLVIWLNDFQVAVVERDRKGKLRLSYTEEALVKFPGGTPLLSLDLPLTPERYPNARTSAFLDGLLPEGEPRRAIAADLDVAASDVFALLAALGKDCAGALVIQPEDEPPPITPTTQTAEPLSSDDLAELVANLRSAPLGVDRNVRLSLAGAQEKLLLTRMPDGSWGRPVGGTPSTHILKPEIERFENTVENELFCMRLAQRLELDVAVVDMILVDERPVLVVERYDRVIDDAGLVTRIHQEDFCQALGLPPERKYEEEGGPTVARAANLLQDVAVPGSPETFLRALTLNVAIGNCDAHAKNFSLLHTESGGLRLAPLYDVLSTRLYPLKDHLAMYVDSVQRVDRVTTDRIVNEASRWSIRRARAEEIVLNVLDRLPDAIAAAANQTPDVPDQLLTQVGRRVENLRASAPARLS
jgi:serine/threonine-protein kinase HipA